MRLRRVSARLVAEKVETHDDFQRCLALGFDLFQGYFFFRPEIIGEGNVSETGLSVMRLLAALEDANNGPKELERIITSDAVLSYRLLRLVNRSEEHTSELQSLMRISYAVFCLKKKNDTTIKHHINLKHIL